MVAGTETVGPYRSDWRDSKVISWLTTVDHKRIGLLYIGTALGFFGLGGLLALLIRSSSDADENFITRDSTTRSSRFTARR